MKINGIDTTTWNPETDPLLYATYHREDMSGKKENKARLQKDLGLKQSDVPLFSVVSRLVPNKGLDLMEGAAEAILKEGGQFVLLGNGEKFYENVFLRLMERYPESVSINLEFNNEKAHRIYGASDVFLMPSRYEPCGLSQLIAMRYGAIPLVHKTGGLADTVIDEDKNEGKGTGFTFSTYSLDALLRPLKKVLRLYQDPDAWRLLVNRAMSRDSSWNNSAKEYLTLYKDAREENNKRKNNGRKVLR